MKKTALPILVAMVVSLMALPAAWAGGDAQEKAAHLSEQCREALKKPSKGATLCQEGIDLHKQGKNREAIAKMQQGLAELQPTESPTGGGY
ncbi:MAG: hypothetical protein FVQ06_07950 [candidate division NC10 bacterium]|nr:hypothetical protein [candidate division NC10 bacterium]